MGESNCVVSVAVLDEGIDVMEIDSQLKIESEIGRHFTGVSDEANSCNDGVEVYNGSAVGIVVQENDVAVENIELDCSAECQTKEVSNDAELNPTESNPCTDIQLKEVPNSAESEACVWSHSKEVSRSTELEVVAESQEIRSVDEHCMEKLPNHPPNDANLEPGKLIDGGNEVQDEYGRELCPTNKAKEASNDDIYSEVSNPNQSPKHATSSLTISSQILDVVGNDPCGYGDTTSVCSRNSVIDPSFHEAEHNRNQKMEPVSTTSVVLEIPKHVSTTGIRKITFKFTKCKTDYDSGRSVIKPETADDFQGDYYDNNLSVSDCQPLTNNSFQNHDQEMNLRIDGSEFHCTSSPLSHIPDREVTMSNKIIPGNYPTNVKKLLSTRILEGARVNYISISGLVELPGIIRDFGYLCGCSACNFCRVVSAYEFELHAGAKTRHPNNHIYLENGKPIYSIIQELKTTPLSTLDDVIKALAGSSVNEEYFKVWKGNFDTTTEFYPYQPEEDSLYPVSCHYSQTPFNQQAYVEAPVERKRLTKKDNDLHKLLFLPNGLPDGTDLAYYSKGKRILGGYKHGNGILCTCCHMEISPSQFESHAGWAAKRQPYRNIYTSNGLTLHDIALMLASGQNLATSGSDDMCAVCGVGGELILCNGCPQAFHAACLGLECLPPDDWYCSCCKDKVGSGRKVSGETRPIMVRLTRVVKAPELEPGGCVFCRSQDFSAAEFDDRTVILCDQCEKEYHVGCLRESGMCDLKELPKEKWFCCHDCNKIFSALQNLTSSGPEVIPAPVSDALHRKLAAIGLDEESHNEIRWHILSGKSRFPEHLLLLSRAAAIFRECFDPIVAKSGRDLIPVMVYGRNISGQEFSGMYCVVLIVKDVVVSAALLRIFGHEVAELPLVATSRENQGKGYFQALFSCIERLLLSMNVKQLVLPAAEDAEPMWTKKLGFRKTNNEQMLKYTRDMQLTMFKGTSLLEKEVQQLAD
ncbi:hypothetical protein MIMGU_mgv1a000809mg [Erythranthe guttata]|uniref:PHD-type domain-containing protein n=1 Tax=Erythranthe guttata TaxID=4155 RepID=A0A022RRZ0_ERYGU|nr:hypothetical protein MIMGU_mgv1a000809mg [Erythranthe guttata]